MSFIHAYIPPSLHLHMPPKPTQHNTDTTKTLLRREKKREREREMTQTQSHSTRWSPTPEQLMLLEEMYRNGVKTPNATQIQQITAQLSRYGRIQGKNVFYWFQNHKARERQKIRRWLSRLYGGYSTGAGRGGGGGGNNSPYPPLQPLLLPATHFQQSMPFHQDGMFLPTDNAFHGIDQVWIHLYIS